ncbi:hypothetical protein HNQ41_003318 [Texcoconibacillus texcoconensis]|uniref:Uncharacterized protein n=1 Tax=Texcoconibacillus texcoconensis TaxID=1095777 RepID=A0A840QUY9_9BACI|nr:hypothetical protein [Texcoconibacillus texcoconensis]
MNNSFLSGAVLAKEILRKVVGSGVPCICR